MPQKDQCFCTIIYVRGYAMTRDEIDDTTADPFCGFDLWFYGAARDAEPEGST